MRLGKLWAEIALPLLAAARTTLLESGKLKWTFEAAYVDPVDSDYAIIKMIMPRGDHWFGIGLGTANMSVGSDMIQFDGKNRKAYDMNANGNRPPEEDP